jgi:hypothetical protein
MQPNLSQLVYSVIRANLQAELAGKWPNDTFVSMCFL